MPELKNLANLIKVPTDCQIECGEENPTHFCSNCGNFMCDDCAVDHACGDCGGERQEEFLCELRAKTNEIQQDIARHGCNTMHSGWISGLNFAETAFRKIYPRT